EDGLGRSPAQGTVVIDLREAEVLVRQPPQPRHRGLDVHAPGTYVVEQPADRGFIHGHARPSAGFARAILAWGEAARSEPPASDERRKGGEARLRGASSRSPIESPRGRR